MKEFFAENWRFIVYLVLAVLGIVISLLKKNKLINETIDTPFERVVALLPGLINEAELSGEKGEFKKFFVISAALGLLGKFRERELTLEEISSYREKLSSVIEAILETPQKKGVVYGNNEEKKN